ncbi:MAG TPA: methyltransferase domain-containing protein [Myxococcales bacterium]|jgi:trans-aconitate 2-methyltransferase
MHDSWNPAQYERFRRERAQPFQDLLALVEPRQGMQIVDLGCGTGDMTLHLHERLKAGSTLGVDRSGAMLAQTPAAQGLAFVEQDIRSFEGGPFDLIFSNAALHWVPDHPALLKRLRAMLAPAGQLAVQMPASDDDIPHQTARELAQSPEFRPLLGGFSARDRLLAPEQYAAWLHKLGFVRQHVRTQVYAHLLESRHEVVEWTRGALLTDYQKRLKPEQYARFLDRFTARIIPQLADDRPFLFVQPRLLFWGALAES